MTDDADEHDGVSLGRVQHALNDTAHTSSMRGRDLSGGVPESDR